MAGYVGVDPSALAAVAGLLDDAALELRGCAALVGLDDDTGERVKVTAVAEWADDPFVNNTVQPWLTPTAPQYGCTGVLETGDPVVGIGFAIGTNTFQQGANPFPDAQGNPTFSADGFYHPEDEAYLQWFMRTSPNTTAEPTQAPSANIGRYTLMGDLNPFPGFRQPATGC